ncbi:MAG: hypothetical protein DRG83_22150 [Deltaproteobacteria bacterium]|nr:MAG: hypothetical protein DRG83_22150 [Deltaproteobacteria bacterium]
MSVIRVPLEPATLEWAMARARLRPELLAKALGVKPERVKAWLAGRERPTYRQARLLAQRLHIPFSQLLVSPPDHVDLPVPDLRRGRVRGTNPSPELLEAIYSALRKRDWYREHNPKEKLPMLKTVSLEDHPAENIAEIIREQIPVQELQKQTSTWSEFLRRLVSQIEKIGILVLRQGYVGSNTRRKYNPNEFSGFAIADPVAPIIFLNTQDFVSRQVFTLAHELAHIWLATSALDADLEEPVIPQEKIERFCDKIAAELLLPTKLFVQVWKGNPYEAAQHTAKEFKVSSWAALRRAWELNLITSRVYKETLVRIREAMKAEKEKQAAGGNFWYTLGARNSATFTTAVVNAAIRGEISPKEVASLLDISLSTALNLLERVSYVSP